MDATTFTADELDPTAIIDALGGAGFEVEPAQRVRRTLLDTFDGRLHAAGLRLELREQAGHELVLTGDGSVPVSVTTTGPPRLAIDLPSGPFRSRLAKVLDVRALLPVMSVSAREAMARRTDRGGRARVFVTVHDQVTVENHGSVLGGWAVEVSEVAGYPKDAAKTRDLLLALGLRGREGDVLDLAAASADIDLRRFGPSPSVALHYEEEALDAFRRVLANLAAVVDANWQGTVDDVDPEFLHDLRVAVRRTRSVLAQGKRVLPVGVRDTYREGFAWLGTVTGRARDLDVYVIEWEGYVAPLGPEAASALEPVLAEVSRRRRAEHAALSKALRSRRYRTLTGAWQEWLNGPVTDRSGKDAERSVGRVAADRTTRAQDRLVAMGRSIGPDTPAEELHELRKDAKKLRYVLECFGGLYAPGPRKAFVQRLKALQDNLGEHQDMEVHAGQLRTIAAGLRGAAGVGPATLAAMDQLSEHLASRRRWARAEFAERFAAYDTKQTRRTLGKLLASTGRES